MSSSAFPRFPVSAFPVLRARSVSRRIHAVLSRPQTGYVLATFARSCYLDFDGQIVALVAPSLLNGPLNVVVDADAWSGRVAVGARVMASGRMVRIDGGADVELQHAVVWDAALRPWPAGQVTRLRRHLPLLRELLGAEAPEGGLARAVIGHGAAATSLDTRVMPAVRDLTWGLQQHDALLVGHAAGTLAGLGPGLTPSGDDVLVGTLLSLTLGTDDSDRIRQAIVAAARDRTTRISRAYLDAAALGETSEAWHRLIDALGGNDTGRIQHTARQVMSCGETSGSDMLAGFVLAAQALL